MPNSGETTLRWDLSSESFIASVVVLTLVASTAIVWTGETAGQFHALAHFYYIPILIAAIFLGPVAGILTALGAALLGGPVMPASISEHLMQPLGDWLTRGVFFVLVGGLAGVLNSRLRAALAAERRQRKQLDILHEIDKSILRDQSLDQIFEQTAQALGELLQADMCCLYRSDRDSHRLISNTCWIRPDATLIGDIDAELETRLLRGTRGTSGSLTDELVACPDLLADTRLSESGRRSFLRLGLRSVILAPLAGLDDDVGGLLVGYARSRRSLENEQLDVDRVAHQAAIAVKNVRQLERLKQFGHEAMSAFSAAVARRDAYTGNHVDRVRGFATAIAQELGLSPAQIETVGHAAQLHDIGKLAVPTDILRKPGPLNRQEWAIVQEHPVVGSQILERISVLRDAAPVVRHHHEHYDGSGYPAGLRGDEIPLGARIVAVVDAFDAMVSDRPYRRALSAREAVAELEKHAGTQFDPGVVLTFLDLLKLNNNPNPGHNPSAQRASKQPSPRTYSYSTVSNVVSNNGEGDVDVE